MNLLAIKSKIKNTLPREITKFYFFTYVFVLLFCFVFFQHSDLFHTVKSSYGYLNGHILDFYDYNKIAVGGNDYFPIIYLIFAIWSLPLKILGLITTEPGLILTAVEIFWAKLLLVITFFLTTVMIHKISRIITNGNDEQSKLTASLFATAPIAVFAVFIFGQYDILGLFITMIGFYYYLQKKIIKFVLFFSLAISFKYFALVIFIPLLLLVEKRPFYLLKYTFMVIAAPLIQIAIYWHSSAFKNHTLFSLAGGKLGAALSELHLSPLNHAPVLIVFYVLICFYSFFSESSDQAAFYKKSIFVSITAYALLFSTIFWHPQWLILITPFFALATLYMNQKEKFYMVDIIGMVAFIFIVVNIWRNGVDAILIYNAPFGRLFPSSFITNADFMNISLLPLTMGVFFIYLFSPLLIQLFQPVKLNLSLSTKTVTQYFYARFLIGLGVFVIPSLVCVFLPKNIAVQLFPHQYIHSLESTVIAETPENAPNQ